MISWRALLDEIGVPWRDRGSNCSRGHINTQCCWCGRDDPSHHLTINEESGAYYCYRRPQVHSGRSLPWLLLGYGVAPSDIDAVVRRHSDRLVSHSLLATPAAQSLPRMDHLDRADGHPAAVEYLLRRGFSDPRGLIRRFDLRFTRTGRFAWRILMSLSAGGDALGLVGRAVRDDMDPRYLTADPFGGCVYLPLLPERAEVLLLVEGPLDALSAAASGAEGVVPVAMLGTALTPERRLTISLLARRAERVVYCHDADQPVASAVYRIVDELRAVPGMPPVDRLAPPPRCKDLGDMAARPEELRTWLRESTFRSGGGRSRITAGRS